MAVSDTDGDTYGPIDTGQKPGALNTLLSRPFTCDICKRSDCEAPRDLDLHCQRCHQEINTGPGVCPDCKSAS